MSDLNMTSSELNIFLGAQELNLSETRWHIVKSILKNFVWPIEKETFRRITGSRY